ncbi:C40 family peptidase [Streptacidiphilus cavernicola]|uniref:C40 family peptidase n=1 Tax=Streptacidiphilus cavernicola TaxID=3342716 RepID=A0ABV6VU65_9ACTN
MAVVRGGGARLETATRPWLRGVLRCGLLLAAASLAVLPLAGTANAASSSDATSSGTVQSLTAAEQTLQPVLDRLHATYQQAEAATQKYDALSEQLTQAQADDAAMQTLVDGAQADVDAGTVVAGQMAAAQYRNSGLSQLGELIFAQDPQQALHEGELLKAAGTSQAALLAQLKTDQQALLAAKAASETAKENAASLVAAQAAAKTEINKQLDAVRKQVAGLTGAQQEELSLLEQKDANAAQTALLASGVLGKDGLRPSKAGAEAVAYAFQQLGAEYHWGAQGPYAAGFDCSGLTSQAWLHAGQPIPRTSEEQWAQLTHIPLNALRPGDLIIYFSGASHVALYIGGGLVIEAPHTGAFVEVAPMAIDPILGAVRPDPDNPSLGSYKPPVIPKGASGPQPIGPGPAPTPKPTPKPKPTPTPTKPGAPSGTPTAPASPTAPVTPTPTPTGSTAAPSDPPTAGETPSAARASDAATSPAAATPPAAEPTEAATSPAAPSTPSAG